MEVGHTCRASPHGVSAQRGALGRKLLFGDPEQMSEAQTHVFEV